MAVFDPNRKRNVRGEQRHDALLRAAAAVFGRLGYHETTTNAIAAEGSVSPATLYQFFPNKEAIANALTERYAREMADAERAIEAETSLDFEDAVRKLLDFCMAYNRKHPEFHTLVLDAPLSDSAKEEKKALGRVFVKFIATRLRESNPGLTRGEAAQHGEVALMIFRGILEELSRCTQRTRPRLQQAMHDAVLRYLMPAADVTIR